MFDAMADGRKRIDAVLTEEQREIGRASCRERVCVPV